MTSWAASEGPSHARGGVACDIEPGGAAERAGLAAGDVLLAADGEMLRDIIDWRWIADGAAVSVSVRSAADGSVREVVLTREPGETWGFAFTEPVFDGVRTCRNRCAFCFVAQLPQGMRASLRVRDDDYRLSFLHGNFITLTNLTDDDVDRIIEQHLSPLYVSIHSSDLEVRSTLIGAEHDRALEYFDTLAQAGIQTHVQIVLVPGVNDGDALDRTLDWLEVRPGVISVGLVPLGYTDYQTRFTSSFDAQLAEQVIARVEPRREAHRAQTGCSWVHLADELYLKAGREVPPAEFYDDFPQYENGIGIVRSFLDDVAAHRAELSAAVAALPADKAVRLVVGESAAPVLERVVGELARGDRPEQVGVLAVRNAFFGGNVSVTGLLTAHDLVPAIAGGTSSAVYLVPEIVTNSDGLLLDDVRAEDLAAMTRRDVRLLSCDADGLLGVLVTLANDRA